MKIRQSQIKGLQNDLINIKNQISTFKPPIATIAELESFIENNNEGDMRVCLENGKIYVWKDKNWNINTGNNIFSNTRFIDLFLDNQIQIFTGIRFDGLGLYQTNSTIINLYLNGILINNSNYNVEIINDELVINWLDDSSLMKNDQLAIQYFDITGGDSSKPVKEKRDLVVENFQLLKGNNNLKEGIIVRTFGFFEKGDKGGAEYLITSTETDWSINIRDNLFANIINLEYVNYRMFGALLDGTNDDLIPIMKAHKYCNHNFVKLKNNFGIIYKEGTDYIEIQYDVDLRGSTLLINDKNCYAFYKIVNNDKMVYAYNLINKKELTKGTSYFTMDTGILPCNCVINIKDNNPWTTRNDDNTFYENYRSDLMYHTVYGFCTGNLIDGYDGDDTDLIVKYTKYNNNTLTFNGCDVMIETIPNITLGIIRCYRHNVILENFHVKIKQNSLGNSQFKGTFIEVKDAFNVKIDNVVGTNIAGSPYNRKGSGYTIRLLNTYQTVITNCNITGFWGCTGMSNVKDVTFRDCTLNRVDVHEYFSNLTVDNCVIYDWGVNVGYGTGLLKVINTKFIFLDKPNVGGSTIININNSYGLLFDGDIIVKNCEVVKSNKQISFINISYIPGLGNNHRTRVKIPNISIEDVIIKNTEPNKQAVWLFKLSGSSDSIGIDRPEYINISNISIFNSDYTKGVLRMINDLSSNINYSDNIRCVLNVKNTMFCDDPVPDIIESNGEFIDIYQGTNSEISFKTDTNLFNLCDINIENCDIVLYNNNVNTNLYINNSNIYAFVESSNIADPNKVRINNSKIRILGYNIIYNRCYIPCARYISCIFNEYFYKKPNDDTIYTTNTLKNKASETYLTNKDQSLSDENKLMSYTVEANDSGTGFECNYPDDTWNKLNCNIFSIKGVRNNGDLDNIFSNVIQKDNCMICSTGTDNIYTKYILQIYKQEVTT